MDLWYLFAEPPDCRIVPLFANLCGWRRDTEREVDSSRMFLSSRPFLGDAGRFRPAFFM